MRRRGASMISVLGAARSTPPGGSAAPPLSEGGKTRDTPPSERGDAPQGQGGVFRATDRRSKKGMTRGVVWFALAVVAAGCAGPRVGRTVDASLPGSRKTEVASVREAGPFYERVETADGDVRTSVRPLLYTRIESPKDDIRLTEVLWPVFSGQVAGELSHWRFLTVYGRDSDTGDPESPWHVWAVPVWFQGRSESGEDYMALFPIAGTMRDFLMFERFSFLFWPIWSTSERHGIHSTYVLWPLYSRNESETIHNVRVFPFWGHVVKDGAWDRHFVLWPIWSDATFYKGDKPDGSAWMLIPLAGHVDRPTVEAWHVLPPFFQVARGRGRFEGDRQILAPWPFVRISDVRGEHKRHFFPIYAKTWSETSEKTDIIWPFYRHLHDTHSGVIRDDWSLAPIFHRTVVREAPGKDATDETGGEGAPVRSYTRLWPLFSTVDEAGGKFFRLLDFSLQRRVGALERNLLQMPVVYTHGIADGVREDELLWGLFRWRRDDDATREFQLWPLYRRVRPEEGGNADWRILWGLFGRESDPDDDVRRTRLLWFFRF